MFNQLRRRWADQSLTEENNRLRKEHDRLSEQIQKLESTLRIKDEELAQMAAVIARDRSRVEAETAAANQAIAQCEILSHRPKPPDYNHVS